MKVSYTYKTWASGRRTVSKFYWDGPKSGDEVQMDVRNISTKNILKVYRYFSKANPEEVEDFMAFINKPHIFILEL